MAGHSKIDFNQPLDLEKLPASLMLSTSQDPANAMPGAPPMFGQDFVPHIFTTAGYVGSAARAYPIEDEALRSSPENAERMRTECGIMECLEARQRATALLPWHLEPEDPTDPKQKQLVVELTKIMERIPRFTEYRRYLMEAIWYGRYMSVHKFCSQRIGNNWRVCIKEHEPRHGDKILFRYDDGTFNYKPGQIGIRVHATWAVDKQPKLAKLQPNRIRHKVEATQYGLAYWLDDYERRTVAVHRHMVEDGPFGDPRSLGRINGIGIRDRIYWTWYAMQECLADLLTFLARAATGVRLWRYPSGNPAWKEKVEAASKNALANGVADILFPVEPNEYAALYGVEQIEPGVGGAQMIQELIQKFFLHKIKRYILGQTLTSEAEATGLGSGVADAHLATFDDIVTYDAINFQETITTDLVTPIKDRNFPEMAGCLVRFIFDIESPNAEKVLAGLEAGWSMGLGIREDDLYQILGTRRPDADDAVLRNPSIAAAQQQIDMNRQQMQQQQAQQAMGLLGGMDAAGMPSQPGVEPVPAEAAGDTDAAGETAEQPIVEEGPQPMAGESSSPGGLKPETGPAVLADPSMPVSPPAEQPAESTADPVADPVAGPAATTDEMQRANPIVSDDNPEPPPMESGPVEGSTPGGDVSSMFADAWNRQMFLDAWNEKFGDQYQLTAGELSEVEQYAAKKFKPMAGQMNLWGPEDEQKHPREKKGGEKGGQFTKKTGGEAGQIAPPESPPEPPKTTPAAIPASDRLEAKGMDIGTRVMIHEPDNPHGSTRHGKTGTITDLIRDSFGVAHRVKLDNGEEDDFHHTELRKHEDKPPALAESPREEKEVYDRGDRVKYTGKTKEVNGGIFHELEVLEGKDKGKFRYTQRGPDGSDPYAEQQRKQHKEMQEGFLRLRESTQDRHSLPDSASDPSTEFSRTFYAAYYAQEAARLESEMEMEAVSA